MVWFPFSRPGCLLRESCEVIEEEALFYTYLVNSFDNVCLEVQNGLECLDIKRSLKVLVFMYTMQ